MAPGGLFWVMDRMPEKVTDRHIAWSGIYFKYCTRNANKSTSLRKYPQIGRRWCRAAASRIKLPEPKLGARKPSQRIGIGVERASQDLGADNRLVGGGHRGVIQVWNCLAPLVPLLQLKRRPRRGQLGCCIAISSSSLTPTLSLGCPGCARSRWPSCCSWPSASSTTSMPRRQPRTPPSAGSGCTRTSRRPTGCTSSLRTSTTAC